MKHLSRALDGQNQWWKYLLVIIIAVVLGQIVGAIPLGIAVGVAVAMNGDNVVRPENAMDFSAYGIDPNLGLALMVLPFIVMLILAIVFIRIFHKRNAKDVVNGGGTFRWNRFWVGILVWSGMLLIMLAVQMIISPDDLELQFNAPAFITLVFVAVLFLPIQSGTEEFIFRGYLAQGVAGWTKSKWLVILIPSLLFALMHGMNPEVKEHGFWVMMPHYFIIGFVFAIMAVLDDGIEVVIGAHAANNTLGAILVTSKESAIQTPSLFFQKEMDPNSELIGLVISAVLVLVVFKLILKWDFSVLNKKVEPVL